MITHLILTGALALNGLKTPQHKIIQEAGIECVDIVPVETSDDFTTDDEVYNKTEKVTSSNTSPRAIVPVVLSKAQQKQKQIEISNEVGSFFEAIGDIAIGVVIVALLIGLIYLIYFLKGVIKCL